MQKWLIVHSSHASDKFFFLSHSVPLHFATTFLKIPTSCAGNFFVWHRRTCVHVYTCCIFQLIFPKKYLLVKNSDIMLIYSHLFRRTKIITSSYDNPINDSARDPDFFFSTRVHSFALFFKLRCVYHSVHHIKSFQNSKII